MAEIDNSRLLWEWVDNRCNQLGIASTRALERLSGVSYGTIARPKSLYQLPTFDLAVKMSQALEVDILEFWQHAGLIHSKIDKNFVTGAEADILRLLEGKSEEFKRDVADIIKILVRI